MESVNEIRELMQNDKNSQNIEFNKENWNCVTSQAFLKSYIQYLMTIDKKKDANGGKTENESGQIGKRPLTDPSTSSDAKRLKLDCEHPSTGEYQLSTIIKSNDWHQNLCKCLKCLKMYEDNNIEFLFGIKTIEWLPTEILLKIFTSLLPSDRRVASESCKRFLEIWLCDDFIEDRRLVFHRCVLDPKCEPLSIFMRSQRNYRHLVFGDVIIRGVSEFPMKFKEAVTTLEVKEAFSTQSINITWLLNKQFSSLKTVKVESYGNLKDCQNLPTTVELLEISIDDFMPGSPTRNNINRRITNYLDGRSDLFRLELTDFISPEDILNLTESQRCKLQRLNLVARDQSGYIKLPQFTNLKFLHFSFFNEEANQREILTDVEKQFPALENFSLEISGRLPHQNWSYLKALETWYIPKREMSRLSIFENLEELSIQSSDDMCFFVHEAFVNKNLKALKIDFAKGNSSARCLTCFQAMTKSFPELESLSCFFCVSNHNLRELTTNCLKLKSLTLPYVHSSSSFACFPNLTALSLGSRCPPRMIKTWPLMLNLRKFDFELRTLDFEAVSMFEKLSALEDLQISCDVIENNQVSLFKTMSKSLKRLKIFRLGCDYSEVEQDNYPEIVDAMVNNCNYLQHIAFSCDRDIDEAVLTEILQNHSSLRSINGLWLK